ncbi:MAG: hypothetical protein MUE61_08440 [Vicinamibacterales bacterium]|nr:hypothetical protein [Vicinamibacterales bacterium]MCU0562340.1 hypothetical protein [Desulfobacterales bacterium]
MAEDSAATLATAEAPAQADTPEAAPQDTAQNTPQSPQPKVTWEDRYKASQAELTRKSMALAEKERLLAELMSEPDEENEEAPAPRKGTRRSEREVELERALVERDWQIAETIYPPEVIGAYVAFAEMFNAAQKPADFIAAAEVYYQRRIAGESPQQAAASPAAPPPSAVLPRADSNRSDAPALPEIEQQLREAEKKRDLGSWVGAKLRTGLGG